MPPHFKTVTLGDSEGRTMLNPKGSLVLELFQAFVWDECSPVRNTDFKGAKGATPAPGSQFRVRGGSGLAPKC